MPSYEFDREGDSHPWIRQLRITEADVWWVLADQVRPAIRDARAAGTGEEDLLQRYQALLGLISRIEELIELCCLPKVCNIQASSDRTKEGV